MTQEIKRQLSCLLVFSIVMAFFPSVNSSAAAAIIPHQVDNPIKEYQSQRGESNLRLWYEKPTTVSKPGEQNSQKTDWEKYSLPLGNGKMGAMLAGQVVNEIIQYNEESLWDGGPSNSRPNYNGGNITGKHKLLKEVQDLMLVGKTAEASRKASGLVGIQDGYGGYRNFGWIDLTHKFDNKPFDHSKVTNYMRDLDLNTATASTSFVYKDVGYVREYFMSYPKNILVIKQTASKKGSLNMDITGSSAHGGVISASGNIIKNTGSMADNQLRFESQIKVLHEGGKLNTSSDIITVTGADEVTLIMSAATDYKNEYPHYRSGIDPGKIVQETLAAVENLTYDNLFAEHVEDYSEIFCRVSLDLGEAPSGKTTDVLLRDYKQNKTSRELEILLFQYGRYMNIASSREGSLPSNLQGVWNHSNSPAWGSDYHINVNLQMNYWPAYATNMAETVYPLIEYVDAWREPGRVTAAEYMGIVSDDENPENGFTAHTQNTPFGWTCPGWSFDWGWSPAAVPWMLQNVWEYYEYTEDLEYMRNKIYPIMREQSKFWQQYLVFNPKDGLYYSAPAYSPEHGPRTFGNVYEHVLVKQLLLDTITASELLGVDEQYRSEWQYLADHLKTEEIGTDGQLKEWFEETTIGSMGGETYHRHISHLLGLYPGDSVNIKTPDLLEAARSSLNFRGDNSAGAGWGVGQRISCWARIQDGDRAYKLAEHLLKSTINENLFNTYPPFQIDANFGYTSGVAEMLIQSNLGFIQPIPAIPSAWSKGRATGLLARGNFEVDMEWSSKTLDSMTIRSKNGGTCTVYYPDIAKKVEVVSKGAIVPFNVIDANTIEWDTQSGDIFNLEVFGSKKSVFVEEITVRSVTGATAIGAQNGTMQMVVNIAPLDANVKDVVWAVTDLAGNPATLATIDEQGLLQAGNKGGAVRVTATATDGSQVYGSIDISLPLGSFKETIIDNQELSSSNFIGNWKKWSDPKHYGGSIHFIEEGAAGVGSSIVYTFNGTGIEVYAPLNATFAALEIVVDGESKGIVDLTADPSIYGGIPQSLIYSIYDLKLGEHTIELVVKEQNNKYKVEFDYFKVIEETNETGTYIDNTDLRLGYSGPWKEYKETKHYNGSIHFVDNTPFSLGSSISYEFYGTGIEVYSTYTRFSGAFDIYMNGEFIETVSLYPDGTPYDGLAQQLIFSALKLDEEKHKIELVVAERDEKYKAEFDCFKVYSGKENVNFSSLQELLKHVESILLDEEQSYTPESFKGFDDALTEAIQLFEQNASNADVENAVLQLSSAIDSLETMQVDKSPLKDILAEASRLNRWVFSRTSWQAFLTEWTYGDSTLRNFAATEVDIKNAVSRMQNSMDALIPMEEGTIDKSSLTALVNLVNTLKQTDYTPETWINLQQPLTHAQNIIHDKKATIAQVKSAIENLQLAVDSLVLKQPEISTDKSKLQALIKQAEALKEADYTPESWAEFAQAKEHARNLLSKEDGTQAQIDSAVILLQASIASLVTKKPNVVPPKHDTPSRTSQSAGTSIRDGSTPYKQTTVFFNMLIQNIQQAKADNKLKNIHLKNIDYIPSEALTKIAKLVGADSQNTKVYLDDIVDGKVLSRIYIDPALFANSKQKINIVSGIEYETPKLKKLAENMQQKYKTNFAVANLKHSGSFGVEVHIAIKPDLSKFNVNHLLVYRIDEKTNKPILLDNAKPRIDSNGYLHYYTSFGGTIIITDQGIEE